ncbi:MAG: sulfate adenylyltransferase, partial [Deltaproteobacteria bacterium]|nr:sulfate adenylyltransferase [Deltaproteobacteria bacterium]
MDKSFFIDIIAHNPPLFQAMADFNSAVVPPVPEEISAVAGLDASALWRFPAVRRHFKTVAVREAFWDFTEESRRLALLDAANLKKLQKLFSVAVHAEEIAKIIVQAEVLAIRDSLGEDIYDYAMYRGQYQL